MRQVINNRKLKRRQFSRQKKREKNLMKTIFFLNLKSISSNLLKKK